MKTILLIALGVVVGVFLCNWSYFVLDKSISLSDILILVITSIIGLYIASTLQNRLTNSRVEKDLLIDEVLDIKKTVQRIKVQANNNAFAFNETKTIFKDINQNIQQLEVLMNLSQCRSVKVDKTKLLFYKLRTLILTISPVNDVIYVASIRTQIDTVVNSLTADLYEIIIKINKQ